MSKKAAQFSQQSTQGTAKAVPCDHKSLLLPKDPLAGLGEIFFGEIHAADHERLSVQILQRTGLGFKDKGQLVGVQGLVGPVKALVELAVLAVAQQGVTGVGELGTDLVGPSGDQLALHQTKAVSGIEHLVIGLAGLASGLGLITDENPVLFGILLNSKKNKCALSEP